MSYAIDRSDELLSVAQTALRILLQKQKQRQQKQEEDGQSDANDDHDGKIITIQPQDLTLHNAHHHDTDDNSDPNNSNAAKDMLSEAVLSLVHLDETLKTLSKLVKRRGHTNDPTNDMNNAMTNFQSFVKDVMEIIDVTLPQAAALPVLLLGNHSENNNSNVAGVGGRIISSGQRRKHYDMASKILKSNVEQRMETFKHVMKVRGDVIKDLTMRRNRLLQQTTNTNTSSDNQVKKTQITSMTPTKVKSQLNSPLFTMSAAPVSNPYYATKSNKHNINGDSISNKGNEYHTNQSNLNKPNHNLSRGYYGNTSSSSTATNLSGYGYSPSGAGYGGYNHHQTTTGMRHRGTVNTTSSTIPNNHTTTSSYNPYQNDDEIKVHDTNNNSSIQSQIQKRRAARQSKTRLESAKMAEKTLSELTTMFSKMSNLIQSQGETLEKIEDDVEIAVAYVDDGYREVGKLYDNTKGNRGLIVKCFGILIFMVVFMKYYG